MGTIEVMTPSAAATDDTSTHETSGALDAGHPLMDGRTAGSPLITAYRGGKPSRRPVWFMRQAGRSLPEYLKVREGVAMLDSCLRPELASEITLQPVRRHDVDAAIFFSDIVIPLKLAGVGVDIVPGVGPVLDKPVRTAADVAALPQLTWEALEPIREAVRLTVAQLGSTPLIGFAGAPFTLAAYMVEGKPSRDHLGPRTMMHADPETWTALANWAADASGMFLRAQLEAGASAAQLFDSWAGSLGLADYERFVAPAPPAPWTMSGTWGRRSSTSAPAPRNCSWPCATSASTSWGSTTGCRWTRPTGAWAAPCRCRATSIPRCSPRPGTSWKPTSVP